MTDISIFDTRPIIVVIGGPNGAGKSTFYAAHLAATGLRFVNADFLAHEMELSPYRAAGLADALRRQLVQARESFIMETVFSDPNGDKLGFLREAKQSGYHVVLCYIGLPSVAISQERVSMRVSQGGHDVPDEKLESRFPRSLVNLRQAVSELDRVLIFDNGDLCRPFRHVSSYAEGQLVETNAELPAWLKDL